MAFTDKYVSKYRQINPFEVWTWVYIFNAYVDLSVIGMG